tara:strand:- start:18251 stop:18997 length:747 start_codon:yes stop_codon:yes gene_type:complete
MIRNLLFVLIVMTGCMGTAHAQKIRAADTGAVHLALDGPGEQYQQPITIEKGDVLWTETIRPLYARVLVDAVEKRLRPSIDGVLAGTALIGVELESGLAFCPAIDFEAPVARVQCFQDFDEDGQFDGGYYTDQRGFDTQFLSGWLRGLAGLAPKISYVEASAETRVPEGTLTVQFDGLRRGAPRFWLYVEKERADNRIECEITEPGVCVLMGRQFAFAETDDDKVLFTPQGEFANRAFSFSSKSSFRK